MIKEKIISNIKTIRESKNLTEDFIAQQMGISQSTYNRKENGLTDFSLTELIKLGDVLEVPLVKIIDLDLARIINQTNHEFHDQSAGVIEHQTVSAEGYLVAIDTLKDEVTHLRAQVDKLIDKLE
jgi:transcriptional regulator with XRE-family HTH domain